MIANKTGPGNAATIYTKQKWEKASGCEANAGMETYSTPFLFLFRLLYLAIFQCRNGQEIGFIIS